jgi:hypothetical protein
VARGSSTVRVRGEFVKFGSSLVRVVWHKGSPSRWPTYCKTLPFLKLFLFRHHRRSKCAAPKSPKRPGIVSLSMVGREVGPTI